MKKVTIFCDICGEEFSKGGLSSGRIRFELTVSLGAKSLVMEVTDGHYGEINAKSRSCDVQICEECLENAIRDAKISY